MRTINVGMLKMSGMLKAILTGSIGQEEDVRLYDLDKAHHMKSAASRNLQALLVGTDESDDKVWSLLENNSNLCVFAVNRNAKRARCFVFNETSLDEPSAVDLLEALRSLESGPSRVHRVPIAGDESSVE